MSKQKRQVYEFDNFRLDCRERQLLREGQAVPIPSKAFDLLVVLIENKGRLVEKEELYQRVWADQVVEESNLTVQVSAIRKALGERRDNPRYIVTVPGHGYRFIGDVLNLEAESEVVIERETLSYIVIEKEEADDGLKIVKAEAYDAPQRRRIVGELRRWSESPAQKALLILGAVGLVILVYYLWSKQAAPSSPLTSVNPVKSIAVLPFKPLVADSRDESLEMGMADTLIARLSNIREINVRPISAVRKYAGLEQDALAAGREQKVDVVLDGQIQKSGEKVRVTVRLLRVEDGAPIWTSQFDQKMTDIFAVQDSISERVAGALALKLSGEEKERLTRHYTEDAEAHRLYMLGRYHLSRMTDDGIRKGLEYFQQAIERDSNFALAHVGVAESYNALAGFNVLRPRDVYPKARLAAELALQLDDLLAQAHGALAMIKLGYDWDWSGAEREFKRALELNPSDSGGHRQHGYYLSFVGRFDEAVAEMRRAHELDPVSPGIITDLGQVLYVARRYDEAIEQCRKALDMDPNLGFAYWVQGLAYTKNGMYERAILALQKSIPLSGDSPDEPASLAHAYALSGKRAEARKILEELQQQAKSKYISPGTLADLYGALGEKDRAFALLDKAYDERDNMMVLLKVEPMFDPLRSDPRFVDLLRRVGFPQ